MKLWQALAYFAREALVNLLRSWKVSLLAVFTIAASLFVGGAFLLVSGNVAQQVRQWQKQTKVTVYLAADAASGAASTIASEASSKPWVTGVQLVDRDAARQQFRAVYPFLGEVVEGSGAESLPASVEISIELARVSAGPYTSWISELAGRAGVEMVDDDRSWLSQLATLSALGRALALGLGAVLLLAAIFTIASVVRLTAYLYSDEISIMRLVGATEFFIRGPFYFEGMIQGLAGGLLAAVCLLSTHAALLPKISGSAWASVILGPFLPATQLALLVLLGAAGGLTGAIVSLRRERLGEA